MTRSKKIFVGLALAFFASLLALIYDISRKTTFPGSKADVKDSLKMKTPENKDTTKSTLSPKSAVYPL